MAIHLRALFIHDANSRLLFINEPDGGGPAPCLSPAAAGARDAFINVHKTR
jgi:hypothetical protein